MAQASDFDLIVLGGGMAGMSAAVEASLAGARVMLCEMADHLGGTAALSTGNVWTVDTAEAFSTSDPEGDIALWRVVRETLDDSFAWLEAIGVPVRERHKASSSSTYDPPPIGRHVDIETFLSRGRRLVDGAGGVVLHGTTISKLMTTVTGVTGAEIHTLASGDRDRVSARGIVLASGGFQTSWELRTRYFGELVAQTVAIRSNPHSGGGGLLLAQAAGAQLSRRMDTFYGVVMPAVPGELSEADYRGLVLHAAVYGVVIGPDGQRLVDESAGAVQLTNAIARVGRALLVVGETMTRSADEKLGIDLCQIIRAGAARGAHFASGSSTAEIAATAAHWGYDSKTAAQTLTKYDAAWGADAAPETPRSRHRHQLDGALLAVEVRAAMTSTLGGIRTDVHGQTMNADGAPIPGLYAAGVDQGGYNVSGYVGGLSRALTFGRRAAARALSSS